MRNPLFDAMVGEEGESREEREKRILSISRKVEILRLFLSVQRMIPSLSLFVLPGKDDLAIPRWTGSARGQGVHE